MFRSLDPLPNIPLCSFLPEWQLPSLLVSKANLDCSLSRSLEIGLIRFTNGQASLGICLHNTIRTYVLNILSALKGRFHNIALCCTGEQSRLERKTQQCTAVKGLSSG